jgi:hypothetical protein
MVWGGKVGKIINSCQESWACTSIGSGYLGIQSTLVGTTFEYSIIGIGTEGGSGDIINSCN